MCQSPLGASVEPYCHANKLGDYQSLSERSERRSQNRERNMSASRSLRCDRDRSSEMSDELSWALAIFNFDSVSAAQILPKPLIL